MEFINDDMVQVWTVYHLQVIGEAATGLSAALRKRYPGLPWADVIAMRNVLVHQYFGIDPDQIWDTVAIDLPQLRAAIEQVIEKSAG